MEGNLSLCHVAAMREHDEGRAGDERRAPLKAGVGERHRDRANLLSREQMNHLGEGHG